MSPPAPRLPVTPPRPVIAGHTRYVKSLMAIAGYYVPINCYLRLGNPVMVVEFWFGRVSLAFFGECLLVPARDKGVESRREGVGEYFVNEVNNHRDELSARILVGRSDRERIHE